MGEIIYASIGIIIGIFVSLLGFQVIGDAPEEKLGILKIGGPVIIVGSLARVISLLI
jgi:hypothetical protein